jgi:putative transposase
MVTAGTYQKEHYFQSSARLQLLHNALLYISKSNDWELHAWAVFSNHYHFIATSPKDPSNLKNWIAYLHQYTASKINQRDGTINRRVWFQYWESKITIHTSYLARLNYVHKNAVKHGLVSEASQYRWCSAFDFEMNSSRAFVKSVYSFDYNLVKTIDDF